MNLDWKNLAFKYLPTNGFVQVDFDGAGWGSAHTKTDPFIPMHVAANCLHYGQACFEGLKAFRTRDGSVVIFRPRENARRLLRSADRLCMQGPSEDLFLAVCRQAVEMNLEFVPPYGTGASLYIRPLLIGTEPMVGIRSSETYSFIVLVTPVGPYYKNGFHPVEALIIDDFDRAAPLGTGMAKSAGNYAASLKPGLVAKAKGFPIVLFTDPKGHEYVDEFGTSNFIGITPGGEYKTPDSTSILPSITNESLQDLARDMGLRVVKEPIPVAGLEQFSEVGACGTAAVITPIFAIHARDRKFTFGREGEAGGTLTKLYQRLLGIQYGDEADKFGWLEKVA